MPTGPQGPRVILEVLQTEGQGRHTLQTALKNLWDLEFSKYTQNHGTSLVIQWLRLCASTAEGQGRHTLQTALKDL